MCRHMWITNFDECTTRCVLCAYGKTRTMCTRGFRFSFFFADITIVIFAVIRPSSKCILSSFFRRYVFIYILRHDEATICGHIRRFWRLHLQFEINVVFFSFYIPMNVGFLRVFKPEINTLDRLYWFFLFGIEWNLVEYYRFPLKLIKFKVSFLYSNHSERKKMFGCYCYVYQL